MSDTAYNNYGQAMGEKGHRTRRSILAAAQRLLTTSPGSTLTVVGVSKTAVVAPTTFYQYFRDIGDVVTACVDEVAADFESLLSEAETPMAEAHEVAAFVESYCNLWRCHAGVLRERNRLSETGDLRFLALRRAHFQTLREAVARRMSCHETEITKRARAGALALALEQLANQIALDVQSLDYLEASRAAIVSYILLDEVSTRQDHLDVHEPARPTPKVT